MCVCTQYLFSCVYFCARAHTQRHTEFQHFPRSARWVGAVHTRDFTPMLSGIATVLWCTRVPWPMSWLKGEQSLLDPWGTFFPPWSTKRSWTEVFLWSNILWANDMLTGKHDESLVCSLQNLGPRWHHVFHLICCMHILAWGVPDCYKPIIFKNGVRKPFPRPTKKVKAPVSALR